MDRAPDEQVRSCALRPARDEREHRRGEPVHRRLVEHLSPSGAEQH
jgi:hypothetical protein